ncbi:hypothetical protein ACWT_3827 [Actinoplanes sp. SE50]|uniref:hypothetical protein n=1 Tax=unclassified Actinoplanes TaxID=2626549 RepID=UPI00023ECCDB|nr:MULTISPECIES: hypothetical protein [unclassified Actinoplanes]AEV84851.1 hypothetical protein ACPL_3956 [Actinoplanes sp. SE50/110]ATO83242.1 hypothetical protein ACWT_3827 [Actinoplanes sp. SE50]SLM00649.1 hypothetical protein ACSP50_3882 [Actinoplanes sp. SE50/110]
MSKKKQHAVLAGVGVAVSALTGVATNVLTGGKASWTLGAVVVMLVVAGVVLAVLNSRLEHRMAEEPPARPDHSGPAPAAAEPRRQPAGGVSVTSAGDDSITVGGNYQNSGMPAGYVVLSLVVVAAVAIGILVVALRFARPSTAGPSSVNTTTGTTTPVVTAAPAPEDLHYDVAATRNRAREVRIKAMAYGQPEPGLTYWFFVDVDYGNNYVEYYPRRQLTGRTTSFDVVLVEDADLKYSRTGRIYGLTGAVSDEAAVKLKRQETTRKNDFFTEPPGQPASDAVTLPF